jgi:hypothetical protein
VKERQGRQRMLTATRHSSAALKAATRSLSTSPYIPRIVDRRIDETGPGGRASDAGLKVAVFGASGLLGRYVCSNLGTQVLMGIDTNIKHTYFETIS